MPARLVAWVGSQALNYRFAAIAEQVGVNEKTVRNIFSEYSAQLQKKFKHDTPVILGLDEIYLGTIQSSICWRTVTKEPSLNSCSVLTIPTRLPMPLSTCGDRTERPYSKFCHTLRTWWTSTTSLGWETNRLNASVAV
jgi:hypothetical protein